MAYSYIWPATLPQAPQKGFTESGTRSIMRTPMDAGPAKQRTRGYSPSILKLQFILSTAQYSTFETFVNNTIKGSYRFGFPHPRTNTVVEARIVPQGSELYSAQYLAPGYWTLQLNIEVLP